MSIVSLQSGLLWVQLDLWSRPKVSGLDSGFLGCLLSFPFYLDVLKPAWGLQLFTIGSCLPAEASRSLGVGTEDELVITARMKTFLGLALH